MRHISRFKNGLFLILLLGMAGAIAWLSIRHHIVADWSAAGRHSLSGVSVALLETLPDPVIITSYATKTSSTRQAVSELVARFQRHKKNLSLSFVDPNLNPDQVRTLGLSVDGELLIQYQGRSENLKTLSESALTNVLHRLARSGERWLVFLEGHGERRPFGQANHDLGSWGEQLRSKGFQVLSQNLAQRSRLPANTRVLVIAGPQLDLLPGEVTLIGDFLREGGNLLWLADPGEDRGMQALAQQLGLGFLPGTIVDPRAQIMGISDPRFALVSEYPAHDITRGLDSVTLFPQSVGLQINAVTPWQAVAFLRTAADSWAETSPMSGTLRLDVGTDVPGPLTVGVALTRQLPNAISDKTGDARQQRVVVIGDGDFLSNAYLGNGGNLRLGQNIINWLAYDDSLIDVPAKITRDRELNLTPLAQGIIGFGFLFVIPLALAGAGLFIWLRRRRR
ncbi:MAG: GldG family protein [Gammaproteobacteria bacterium]|nr:GldG family protein [Gammaproteobacteria bacterium]